ncbi:MAG TPA: hypothetical protein VGR90_00600 [Acidimicrobiales bacterium]|nr:hypothetical protein [Acidimicrobiales bacterium]
MPHPLDEYPIHQAPLSMRYVTTSDRNFYDRCYFNAHDRTGDIFLVTGLGVYPNLGVIDAYATIRRGERQWTIRCSDALGEHRLEQKVGPYRIEVVEPLQKVRLVCDGDAHGVGFDLTWDGSFAAVDEPRHLVYARDRLTIDGCRFAQVGTWSGSLRVDGEEIGVDPAVWVGSRDRSWGIRPVGEGEPAGRPPDGAPGFWWLYVPLRFDDFALIVIAQEQADGTRTLNEAVRVFPDGRHEQLGWPEVDIRYRPGTRHPVHATLEMRRPGGKPLTLEVDTLGHVAMHLAGYGAGDPEWRHGQWRGETWVEGSVHELSDPAVAGRIPFGVVDHVGRASCDGVEGWGLFEHATIGRHDPSGFADLMSVAP